MDQNVLHLKPYIKTLTLTIPNGDSQDSKTIEIPKGYKVLAAAKANQDLNQIVNLGIYEQGQEINTPMDLSFWRDREIGKNFTDGFVVLNTTGSSEVEVRLNSPFGTVSSDVQVQVVFIILQEPC